MRRGAWQGENRRRLLLLAALLAVATLAVVWWQPWRVPSQPPAPTPRPTMVALAPTSTAGTSPDRIIEPPVSPTEAAPTSAAITSATPSLSATPTFRDARGLIYLGRVDGPPGIVALNADGGERRLIAPGVYLALAWSPNGERFAALGGNGYEQIAIFDGAGRPLARHALRPGTDCELRWSPDSRFVVCVPLYPFQGRERTTILIADEEGVREVLVPPVVRTSFLGWPRPGALTLLALPEEWPYAAAEVWQIDLASGDVRRLIQGDFWPLGWSADGRTLLALGGRQPRGGIVQSGQPVFTELIAVDIASGERRTVDRANQIAPGAVGASSADRSWFSLGLLSPTGRQLALWVVRDAAMGPSGAPDPATEPTLAFLTLSDDGTSGLIGAVIANAAIGVDQKWSPDGQLLARVFFSATYRQVFVAIIVPYIAGTPTQVTDGGAETAITWSPDGRWFAYIGPQGLTLASTRDTGIAIIDPEGRAPAWRPVVR